MFHTDNFDEIDETWTHGTFIGGLAGAYHDAGVANQYMLASDQLVSWALQNQRAYDVILPVLFLCRHGLELRLKHLVRPAKLTHDLVALTSALDEELKTSGFGGLTSEFVSRVGEFHLFDERADAFRFHAAKATKGLPPKAHFPEEIWVDLAYIRDVASRLESELAWCARVLRR